MILTIVVVLGSAALVALGVMGMRSSRAGSDLGRAGLMEIQNLLEPERKVEILREKDTRDELVVRLDETGDPVTRERTRAPPGSRRPAGPS
jgi:hypothetical protein